jgi:peptidoglycan/LPS O-acetylase OafA/YrhL
MEQLNQNPASRKSDLIRDRLDFIDALRGWAILGVMLAHSGYLISTGTGLWWTFLLEGGGFTLCYAMYTVHKNDAGWVPFFIRRFFRIAPMFYIAIVLAYVTASYAHRPVSPGAVLSSIFFVHGISPYWINELVPGGWSVTVEAAFYVLFPMLFTFAFNLKRASLLVAASLVIAVVLEALLSSFNLIQSKELWLGYLNVYFPSQLPVFCMGILTFELYLKLKSWCTDKNKNVQLGTAMLIAGLSGFVLLIFLEDIPVKHCFFSVAFIGIILGLALNPNVFFVNSRLQWMGKISYSAYLLHFVALCLGSVVKRTLLGTALDPYPFINLVLGFIFVVVITSIMAGFTWRFVERKGILLGKKFVKRAERMNGPSEVPAMAPVRSKSALGQLHDDKILSDI